MGVRLFDRKFAATVGDGLPARPGVYLFVDECGEVLYVGKAKNLRRRLANYRNASRRKVHRKMRALVREASTLEVRPLESEREALLLENELIRSLRPAHNVDGAYSFLYPAIGLSAAGDQVLLAFSTDTARWADLDLQWFGVFRSRPRAKEAFDALVEMVNMIAHREPKSRLPAHRPLRGSRLVAYRRLDGELRLEVARLLAGLSPEPLGYLAARLVEKPRARREAERVQECLRCLSAFYESDLRKLHDALALRGTGGTFVPQAERDALFIQWKAASEATTSDAADL